MHGICSEHEPIYIVTEFMPGGSLRYFLSEGEGQSLQLPKLCDMTAQVAAGMAFLETQGYIHRNLFADNILVSEKLICKVSGFGIAKRSFGVDLDNFDSEIKFPIKWTAPESLSTGRFSIKSTVWSFGILMTEIVTKGALPYSGMTNPEVVTQVIRGYRMPKPPRCPEALYQVMLYCWSEEPKSRPTFEYLQHTLEDDFAFTESGFRDLNQPNP